MTALSQPVIMVWFHFLEFFLKDIILDCEPVRELDGSLTACS